MGKSKRRRPSGRNESTGEPRVAEAWLERATTAHRAGDLTQAAVYYRKSLKSKPDKADVWHTLGGVHYQLRNMVAACAALEVAVRHAPDNANYRSDLGGVYLSCGRPVDAESELRRAIECLPDFPEAEYNLAQALHAQGKIPEAIATLRGLVRRQPQFTEAHYNLGVAEWGQGRLHEATELFETVLRLQADNAQAYLALARVYRELRFMGRALDYFKKYFERIANDVDAVIEYAEALHENGQTDEAVEQLRASAAGNEHDDKLQVALGRILQDAGDIEQAEIAFRNAMVFNRDNTVATVGLSGVRRFRDPADPVIGQIRAALQVASESGAQQAALHFALGKIHDDLGEYDTAFGHFRRGNEIKHKDARYEPVAVEEYVERILAVFSAHTIERLGGVGHRSELPVLFVGMPRSGTTLAEQVLASHPHVQGAGELGFYPSLVNAMPGLLKLDASYPACCLDLDRETMDEIATQYLALLRRHSTVALRVSDKMPGNYFHLGLIAALFPQARFVSCRRELLDLGLSIYFQFFREPLEYAWDLSDIVHYYSLYRRLMTHWVSIMPERILMLDYEDMVSDLEQTARRLVDFCGLDWDPSCLAFHETRRDVKTASNWQVRQPIYQSSVGRWKNYQDYLGPLAQLRNRKAGFD